MNEPISFHLSKGGVESQYHVISRLAPNRETKANELIVEIHKHGKQIAELCATTDSSGRLLVYATAGGNPDEYRITIHPEAPISIAAQLYSPGE